MVIKGLCTGRYKGSIELNLANFFGNLLDAMICIRSWNQ